jgi:hypothetical protein
VFQQASAQIKNMLFVTSGLLDEWQSNIASSFGIGKEQVPMLMLMFNDEENSNGLKKYKWDGDLNTITVDDI